MKLGSNVCCFPSNGDDPTSSCISCISNNCKYQSARMNGSCSSFAGLFMTIYPHWDLAAAHVDAFCTVARSWVTAKSAALGLPPNCPSGFWQYMHSEMTRTYTNWYWNGECLRNTVAIFMYKKIRWIWWSLILKVLVANETRVRCPYIMGNISNCMDFELPNCYLEVQYICSKLAKHPLIGETRRAGSYVVMYIIIWLVYIISSRIYIYMYIYI